MSHSWFQLISVNENINLKTLHLNTSIGMDFLKRQIETNSKKIS